MIKKLNFGIGLILCLGSSFLAQAQKEKTSKQIQPFPVSLAFTNQSWAFPGAKVFRLNPLYPGLSIGSEYQYRSRPKALFYQTLEVGGFINRSAGSALYAHTNIGLRRITDFGLSIDFSLGLGYFHGFHPSYIYAQNETGTYQKLKDKGIGATAANINIQLGYHLKNTKKQVTPFVSYQWMASTHYWSLITIRPNGFLKAGLRFNINKFKD